MPSHIKRTQRKEETANKILQALQEQDRPKALEYSELLKRSGLPKGTLSKYVIMLSKEKYIKIEGQVVQRENKKSHKMEDKLVTFYLLDPELGTMFYEISEDDKERLQICINKNTKVIERINVGLIRKPRAQSLRKNRKKSEEGFCRTGETATRLEIDKPLPIHVDEKGILAARIDTLKFDFIDCKEMSKEIDKLERKKKKRAQHLT